MNKTTDEISGINQAFYDAFASGDYKRMEELWSKSDQISVIHPGSQVLHGYRNVMASWRQILGNGDTSNIRCVDARVIIPGDIAYVICSEVFPEGQLTATNIFVRENGNWFMMHHQAGPVNRPKPEIISPGGKSIH